MLRLLWWLSQSFLRTCKSLECELVNVHIIDRVKGLIRYVDSTCSTVQEFRFHRCTHWHHINLWWTACCAGFKESARACCGSGYLEVAFLCNEASRGTCQDASEFIFFDSFHPTDRFYSQLGQKLFEDAAPILVGPAQPWKWNQLVA